MKKILSVFILVVIVASILVSCANSAGDAKTITVAASATPHAEILEQCKSILKDKGYTLKIKVMDDYVIPNTATESGDVDANYFQHAPYLEEFNIKNKTHLVPIEKIHYEPYAIYAGTVKSLDSLKKGSKIAVPNDPTNEARALLLLEANGIIKLKEDAGLVATKNDIIENAIGVEILEMEAALIPGSLDDVAMGIINGNYALGANLKVSDALAVEDAESQAAQTYANILVTREDNENNEAIKALAEALKSEQIKEYIKNTYKGAVVPLS